jgi:type II secretory ATPase GspE/PulE/Tfp pilus assembly ATPase PilB-like protein
MGAAAAAVADVVRVVFTTRLFRPPRAAQFMLLHEELRVTDAIRALILADANADAIYRRAIADGMRSLRQVGLAEVHAGRLPRDYVVEMTPED